MGGRGSSSNMSNQFSNTRSWTGGTPLQRDTFHQNANRLGLEVHREQVPVSDGYTTREYVILNSPLTVYHNADKSNMENINKRGLLPSDRNGGQVSGVYLTGGKDDLAGWADNNVTLAVTLPAGTKLYRDVQPNALFVREKIPKNRIKVV